MRFPIMLDSNNANVGCVTDVTFEIVPELRLDELGGAGKYFIALDKIEIPYSWHVSSDHNNNTFKYSDDDSVNWHNFVLPNGNYDYKDLENFFKVGLKKAGKSETEIKLEFIYPLLLVRITLEDDFQVDFWQGEFAELIGFNKRLVTATSYGDKRPDITRSVDLISNSLVSGTRSDALYTIPTANLPISHYFKTEPKRVVFSETNKTVIIRIRVYLTDPLGRPVDLGGVSVDLTIILSDSDTGWSFVCLNSEMSDVRRERDEDGNSVFIHIDGGGTVGSGFFDMFSKGASKLASKAASKVASKLTSEAAKKLSKKAVEKGSEKVGEKADQFVGEKLFSSKPKTSDAPVKTPAKTPVDERRGEEIVRELRRMDPLPEPERKVSQRDILSRQFDLLLDS